MPRSRRPRVAKGNFSARSSSTKIANADGDPGSEKL
jgi:hypothetical protein